MAPSQTNLCNKRPYIQTKTLRTHIIYGVYIQNIFSHCHDECDEKKKRNKNGSEIKFTSVYFIHLARAEYVTPTG